MKHLIEYIKEAKEVVIASYINELQKEFNKNRDDEDTYLEVTAKLFKYLDKLTDIQIKSLCDQIGLESDNDINSNKALILLYITK